MADSKKKDSGTKKDDERTLSHDETTERQAPSQPTHPVSEADPAGLIGTGDVPEEQQAHHKDMKAGNVEQMLSPRAAATVRGESGSGGTVHKG